MTIHLKPATEDVSQVVELTTSAPSYGSGTKRLFDLLFVLAVLPIVFPVILVVAFFVSLDGGNPFFVQQRVGRDGRIFPMIKLRSMVVDAEGKLLEYLASDSQAKQEWEEKQKLTNDPRITLVGRIIRKTSIDELPQFLNVLSGDMSVVGPRPMMPSQREMYPGRAYYALKPGVTGFWQIGDRHATSFADRARFDSDYYNEMSFRTDVSVVLKTIKVVLRGTGA